MQDNDATGPGSAGGRAARPKTMQCQATGCTSCLVHEKAYFQRHRVCATHLRALEVDVNGECCRFCQQCARFHPTTEFDGIKRSCRTRLSQHNARRRCKPETDSLAADDDCMSKGHLDVKLEADDASGSGAMTGRSELSVWDARKLEGNAEGSFDISIKGRMNGSRRPVRAAALACTANLASVAAALAAPLNSKDTGAGSTTDQDPSRRPQAGRKHASTAQLPGSCHSQGSSTQMQFGSAHALVPEHITEQRSWDHMSNDMMASCSTPVPMPSSAVSPQSKPSQPAPALHDAFGRNMSSLSAAIDAAPNTHVIHNVAMAAGWGMDTLVDSEMKGLVKGLQGSRKRPAHLGPVSEPNMASGWSAPGLLAPGMHPAPEPSPEKLWAANSGQDVLVPTSNLPVFTVQTKLNSMPILPSWNTTAPAPGSAPTSGNIAWTAAPKPPMPPALQTQQLTSSMTMWTPAPQPQLQPQSSAMITDSSDWLNLSDDLGLPKIPDDSPDSFVPVKVESEMQLPRADHDMTHARPLARQRSDAYVLEVGLMDKLCVASSPAKAVPTKFSYAPVYQSMVVPSAPAPQPAPQGVSVFHVQPQQQQAPGTTDLVWVPVERPAALTTPMAAEPLWLVQPKQPTLMEGTEELPAAPAPASALAPNPALAPASANNFKLSMLPEVGMTSTPTPAPAEARIAPHEVPQMLAAISMKVANCLPENLPGELYKRLHLLVTTSEASKLHAMLQQSELLLALV